MLLYLYLPSFLQDHLHFFRHFSSVLWDPFLWMTLNHSVFTHIFSMVMEKWNEWKRENSSSVSAKRRSGATVHYSQTSLSPLPHPRSSISRAFKNILASSLHHSVGTCASVRSCLVNPLNHSVATHCRWSRESPIILPIIQMTKDLSQCARVESSVTYEFNFILLHKTMVLFSTSLSRTWSRN